MITRILVVCLLLAAALPARAAELKPELLFEEKLEKTEGIAVCPNGRLFVAENERGTVYEILGDGGLSLVADGLARPAGMACAPDNTLFVLLYASGEAVSLTFTENGPVQKTVSEKLTTPNAAAVSSDGTLFVSETDNGRVVVLGRDGSIEELAGGIPYANGLALNEDETILFVNSTTGGKMFAIPLAGEHRGKKKTVAKGIQMADGIVRAPDGTLYIASYAKGEIAAVAPDGQMTVAASGLVSPASPAIWNGALFVTSLNGKGVYRIPLGAD